MAPDHFQWELKDGLGIITLNRPERKNPLTFDSYAELRDTFRDFSYTDEIRAVISSFHRYLKVYILIVVYCTGKL